MCVWGGKGVLKKKKKEIGSQMLRERVQHQIQRTMRMLCILIRGLNEQAEWKNEETNARNGLAPIY